VELDHRESRIGWTKRPAASTVAIMGSRHSILIKRHDCHGLVPEDLRRTL